MSMPRYHYLDNLRAMAMMLGILIHVALSSIPLLHDTYVLADQQTSSTLEAIVLFVHLFRMQLFMFIAGFFAHYLIEKKGLIGFIKNRSLRVLIPFLIFLPIILITITLVIYYGALHLEQKPLMLQYIIDSFSDPSKQKDMPISTAHLWFLYYLIIFYLISCVFVKFKIFNLGKWFESKVQKNFNICFLLILPLILIPSFYLQDFPLAAPDKIYPQLWAFILYGTFFATGWLFFGNDLLLHKLKNLSIFMLLLSLAAYLVTYFLYPKHQTIAESIAPHDIQFSSKKILIATLEAFIAAYMVLFLVSVGQRYLNFKNSVLRYIADSSYWVYLVHLPILMFIQVLLLEKPWNVWLKFTLISVLTLTVSIISYHLFVRFTKIGQLLNGKRQVN